MGSQTDVEAQVRRPIATITPAFKANAVKAFAELASRGPVQRVTLGNGLDAWAVLSYDQARAALTHPALLHDATPAEAALDAVGYTMHKVGQGIAGSMLLSDPPDHTRLRRLVAPAFSPRRTRLMAGRVQEICDDLLEAMAPAGETDLVESFTAPLPITVICELLGVPETERAAFRQWTDDMLGLPSEQQRKGAISLFTYLSGLVERKQGKPEDDLLSDLSLQQNAEDGRLSREELIGTAVLLVVAGHDTTVNLLGNALVALFRQPAQAQLLREQPDLIEGAVEEFLRLDSSVEMATLRYAAEDLELAGVPIRRGDVVAVYLAQASRDAPQNEERDLAVLDVARRGARHMAFGHGIHHCLGAPLARIEAAIAIRSLLQRFPDLHLSIAPEDVQWIASGMMRGPLSLPVRFAS